MENSPQPPAPLTEEGSGTQKPPRLGNRHISVGTRSDDSCLMMVYRLSVSSSPPFLSFSVYVMWGGFSVQWVYCSLTDGLLNNFQLLWSRSERTAPDTGAHPCTHRQFLMAITLRCARLSAAVALCILPTSLFKRGLSSTNSFCAGWKAFTGGNNPRRG